MHQLEKALRLSPADSIKVNETMNKIPSADMAAAR